MMRRSEIQAMARVKIRMQRCKETRTYMRENMKKEVIVLEGKNNEKEWGVEQGNSNG